jgi:succinyl-diaminopimelate desuccinylase
LESQQALDHRQLLSQIEEAELIGICQDLVRFQSVNPPGNELEVAQYVADVLGDAGLHVELVRHSASRASVIARLRGTGEISGLLYNGHLDVVPVGAETWTHDPFGAEMAGGRVWGRGTSDMKGGVAAMMVAAATLARSELPLRGDLVLAFTADEEVDWQGAREVAARGDVGEVQALIIGESTDNQISIAQRGQLLLRITTRGRAAHSSTPELGRNAIMMMVELLSKLDELPVPHEPHPLLGSFSRNVGTIAGGTKTNMVPDSCTASVDQRTVPGQDHEDILTQVEQLVAEVGESIPGFEASIEVISDFSPMETAPDAEIVEQFRAMVTEIVGSPPELQGTTGLGDGTILVPALGAPMIIFGPGDPKVAHQTDEYVEVRKLLEATKVYVLAAARLLS